MRRKRLRKAMMMLGMAATAAAPAHAFEHLTLRDGRTWDCTRHETVGDRVRIYTSGENYIEVKAEIASVDVFPDPVHLPAEPATIPAKIEMSEMLANAGHQHNVDVDLLASIVKAESNGQVRAVSRTGAQGLMQLMPATAREQGVTDSFEPQQNINGGTKYLDWLLTYYHDDMTKAVAAYNAGPAAVDRYHGVPPYRETQAYVRRVINEFNRRKKMQMAANKSLEIASK